MPLHTRASVNGPTFESLLRTSGDFAVIYLGLPLTEDIARRLRLVEMCPRVTAANGGVTYEVSEPMRTHAESVCTVLANEYVNEDGTPRHSRRERVAALNRRREEREEAERHRLQRLEEERDVRERAARVRVQVAGVAEEARTTLEQLRMALTSRRISGAVHSHGAFSYTSVVPPSVVLRFERRRELMLLVRTVDEVRGWPLNQWRALGTGGLTYSEMCCLIVKLGEEGMPAHSHAILGRLLAKVGERIAAGDVPQNATLLSEAVAITNGSLVVPPTPRDTIEAHEDARAREEEAESPTAASAPAIGSYAPSQGAPTDLLAQLRERAAAQREARAPAPTAQERLLAEVQSRATVAAVRQASSTTPPRDVTDAPAPRGRRQDD